MDNNTVEIKENITEVTDNTVEVVENTAEIKSDAAPDLPHKTKGRVVCLLSVLLGGILASVRMMILFGEYDPSTSLYPSGTLTDTFWLCSLIFSCVLLLSGLMFKSMGNNVCIQKQNTPTVFMESFVGFSFFALAMSVAIGAKIAHRDLSRLDAVLVILSMIAAISFVASSFLKKDKLSGEASVILMLFRPLSCLFITFYFYFDQTSVIHNSNKKVASLFFVAVLISLLYSIRFDLGKAKTPIYTAFTALAVCHGISFAIPDLVYYFVESRVVLISIFVDILAAALTVYSAISLLYIEKKQESTDAPDVADNDNATAEDPAVTDDIAGDDEMVDALVTDDGDIDSIKNNTEKIESDDAYGDEANVSADDTVETKDVDTLGE